MKEYSADEAIKAILKVFEKNHIPSGISICNDDGFEETKYISNTFNNTPWWEMDALKLYRTDILHFFTSEGFCYYFPFFMIYVLRNYEDADIFSDSLLDIIGFKCDPLHTDNRLNYISYYIANMDNEKILALKYFLQTICIEFDNDDACQISKCFEEKNKRKKGSDLI